MARITWRARQGLLPGGGAQRDGPPSLPSFSRKPVTWVSKRTSPPRASNLPPDGRAPPPEADPCRCGAWPRRGSPPGAPAATSSSSTLRMRPSPVPVVSLPSEKVPAPPSPNWTLDCGIQHPLLPEALNGALPLLHGLAPLQDDGLLAALGQQQGGEHPRRAKAHHHRPLGQLASLGRLIAVGLRLLHGVVPAAGEEPVLVPLDGGLHRADKVDVVLFPGVHRFLAQPHLPDGAFRQAQLLGRGPLQIPLPEAQGQFQPCDFQHIPFPFLPPADCPAARPVAQAQ